MTMLQHAIFVLVLPLLTAAVIALFLRRAGGIASVLPEALRDLGDSEELHIADTLDAGAGLCKEAAVRTIIGEGAAAIVVSVADDTVPAPESGV